VTPVVLLHAFPLDHRLWDAQAEFLGAHGFEVQVPDLAGFGRSAPPSVPSLWEIAAPVVARLDRPAVFAGLSMGGYLLMEILRKTPEKVAGAIFVDTKATADAPAARKGRFDMAHAMEDEPDLASLAEALLPNLLGATTRAQRPEVVERVRTWITEAPPAAIAAAQRAMADRPDSVATLRIHEGPAAVVWGSEDTLSPPAEQRLMLEAMPQAVGREIPGVGHLSAVEDPAAVTDVLLEVLSDWLG
jgi:pimeloyl-ACP methyl ester carboxylesterase